MATDVTAMVYMSGGRWVAMCPREGCTNAEAFGRCDDGTLGGLGDDGAFRCRTTHGGCGLVCAADWPPNVSDIEGVVMARPAPSTRNWVPGETIADLVAENIEHGLVPGSTLDRVPLMVAGDEVTRGQLGHGFVSRDRAVEG